MIRPPPRSTLLPYPTLFRSSTRLNSSHTLISYAVTGVQTCARSEEHTSELQSHSHLVCRLLLEKKNAELGGNGARSTDFVLIRIAYNSCRNRHCPKCQGLFFFDWRADPQDQLFPPPRLLAV